MGQGQHADRRELVLEMREWIMNNCPLNDCGRPQGAGTWVRIDGEVRGVCETHWEALRIARLQLPPR